MKLTLQLDGGINENLFKITRLDSKFIWCKNVKDESLCGVFKFNEWIGTTPKVDMDAVTSFDIETNKQYLVEYHT